MQFVEVFQQGLDLTRWSVSHSAVLERKYVDTYGHTYIMRQLRETERHAAFDCGIVGLGEGQMVFASVNIGRVDSRAWW